ncbi:PREDICTED: interferon-induced, double-stranded RNA-activated protein kinase-like isoform X1 [Cyprinodon variegatus]|uniref:interferon-induced, double-stranded RNA-activated protein kinase-like isoform X1 n=1 Tax=Cyprinodon variegatus TaxID=28743 RepID=UPI000742B37E|nr:PREDICTED: interferon-induced, double-stranded RNA-activated protein kinase-like isoform X1 [Cyprinodon variegatus]
MDSANYVARLNEYAQKERLLLKYEEVGSVGPDHIKTFSLKAVVNGKAYPEGVGKNKKEAKQNAAKNALQCLLEEPSVSRGSIEEAPPAHMQLKTNYMCWLNEYGQTNRVVIRAVESITPGQNTLTQGCRFVVGDKEYPVAYGRTKKDAREEAARLVHHEIMGGETLDTEDDRDSGTSSLHCEEVSSDISNRVKRLSLKSDDSILMDTNFIGMVNSYCQKTRRSCVYKEEKRCGPPHNPVFFYKLLINDTEFPVCEGKSAKEAKQKAAQMAWSALKEQSDWDSKVARSNDGAQSKNSPPTSIQDSGLAKAPHETPSRSESNPPKDQVKSPKVKPQIRIAAKFLNISEKSKEDVLNFKKEGRGNPPSVKSPTQPVSSRFTADYDSIERLDKGSFGRVFKAKHKLEDKYYAVKIVHYREKTLQEVKVLSDLNHCNIVRYHSCWLEDGTYQWDTSTGSSSASQSSTDQPSKFLYIQMELCEIKTLRVWIDEKNIQNHKKSLRDFKRREESLNFALQMISGVEHIHSRKLIHRDLKPANIMFSRNGTVKIGDFGLVTSEIEDDAENQKERRGYKGTPSYMAPEQRNRKLYDRKVDIFALGLIFFELLWNIPTLNDKNEMWDKVRNQELPQGFIYHFSRESQMINSMLCSNPEERPEASKIKINLEEHIHSLAELKTKQRDSKTI